MVGAQRPWTTPVSPGSSDAVRLPHSVVAVGMARHRVRYDLTALGVSQTLLDDVEVVLSELLGNAVRHARPISGGVVLMAWQLRGPAVTIKITDGGSASRVEPRGAETFAEAGRGLQIVGSLARDWGVTDHPAGLRTVWATLVPELYQAQWRLAVGGARRLA